MILIALLLIASILTYIFVIKPHSYWTNRGVKQRKQFYLLGDNAAIFFKKENIFEMVDNMYKAFPEERYIGIYQSTLPTLLIRDPELIKQIAVKEFDHFLDHRQFIPDGTDPVWSRNLFALKGKKWKNMRATLSPSFTSSKMRMIFTLISECVSTYMKYFKSNEVTDVELKDTFTRYANDIIATVAFGVKCDSINQKDNEFYVMGKRATNFTFLRNVMFLLYMMMPNVCKYLNLKAFPQPVTDFFKNLVIDTIKSREEQGIVRPDMLQLLMEARKGKRRTDDVSPNIRDDDFATVQEIKPENGEIKTDLTDTDVAGQALIFFFAGFETVSTLMCFLVYELTINPDIQMKVQEEIDKTAVECDGKLTYETLTKMKYLDMVVSECLRKWPAAVMTDRVCTRRFTIDPVKPGERAVDLNVGDAVWFPVAGLHRDPKYYPNPDKFDPERFNDENKHLISPYTYLPFGLGPRNCIGGRFALLEVKTIIYHLLSDFDFVVTKKTQIPVVLSKKSFTLTAEKGFWIGLKPRTK